MQEKYLPHYTIEDYRRWEGKWELIYGIPYAMSPSPKRKHQRIGVMLLTLIDTFLLKEKDNCGKCVVVYELDWNIAYDVIVCPDIAIVCDEESDYISSPPALIIEILSPSTALNDRNTKFEIYQNQGVKYYLLIDPKTKSHNVFVLENGKYKEHNNLSSFQIHGQCSIEIDLPKVLAELE